MRAILVVAAAVLFAAPTFASADERIFGVWEGGDGSQLEILDGFKSGVGPALLLKQGEEVAVGSWNSTGQGVELSIGFGSGDLKITGPDNFTWLQNAYSRMGSIADDNRVRLSGSAERFIAEMTSRSWRTSLDGDRSILKTTFSDDSGVVETFDAKGELASLNAWSVSSDVLKIASTVIVEARISPSYLVGIDDDDEFFVMKALEDLPPPGRTSLKEQREEFLAAMVTDSWQTVQWTTVTEHRFRPIEGPLKGRKLELTDGQLIGSSTWEYSPSTGAIKIGYMEYTGGVVVGDTLALLDSDGDQVFFSKTPGGNRKSFTTNDVRRIDVNENATGDLAAAFEGQFQRGEYLYDFEFSAEGREGFVHQWRSAPFSIRGQSWSSALLSDHEVLYEVEDFLVLGEGTVLKRDASPSRLGPKSAEQVAADQTRAQATIDTRTDRGVVLKITREDGSVEQIALPVTDMSEIAGLEIVVE